jgi:folate-binding protein YgfZ
MTKTDPLRKRLIEAEASWLVYGHGPGAVELVGSFGSVELEYAAIRRGCVLLDQPHRATLRLTGSDRRALMNSLFTQELKDLAPGMSRRTLWLNRKGRIDADLRIIELEDETFLDVDRNAAERARASIDGYIITEDAAIGDVSGAWRRLALHGPKAGELLAGIAGIMSLEPGQSQETAIAGVRVIVDRQDSLGAPGYELLVDAARVDAVDGAIVAAGEADESLRLRRCGWLACNTARIEAGWPLYLTDFGPDSIPNELGGLLADRVSFTKGCYLGQEVVARIHAQGRPKRLLSAIRFERVVVEDGAGGGISMGDTSGMGGAGEDQRPTTLQPATAMEIYDVPGGTAIGAVTSATLSPMLGDVPIAFAQLRTSAATEGSVVHVDLGVRTLSGTVQGGLRFL